ncbi:MAG: hypothetical protein EHM93_13575 [Bacteroidales bacterium]|nr:MAG: hypothetical protein EHM93_13575 [Bacteroidales bacterium]
MKTKLIFALSLAIIAISTVISCKKDDSPTLPTLTTTELTEITDTSATTGGSIASNGGSDIISSGVCWSTSENPTITDNITAENAVSGDFISKIKGLKGGVNYYVRAYATNSIGTGYGQSVSLTTIIKNQSLSYGASYADDIYYSLKNGVISTVPRATWDIAFSVYSMSSSIIINESNSITLKAFPNAWTWASTIDTAGFSTWLSLRNSDTSWETGAFNANATGHPNYGWGIYNPVSHNIVNAEGGKLYIIKFADKSCKKVWVEIKYSSLQKYSFRFANLDGSNEHVISNLDVSTSNANFVYYSLQSNTRLDREPDTKTWDLLFTRWEDLDGTTPYIVAGVLQNYIAKGGAPGSIQDLGVKAIEITTSDPSTISYTDGQFSTNINTIGWKWKTQSAGVFSVPTNKYYIVKDKAGRIYQIQFLTFSGGSTGNFSFNIKQL